MKRNRILSVVFMLLLFLTACNSPEQETYESKRQGSVETAFDYLKDDRRNDDTPLKELPPGGYLTGEEIKVFENESVTSDIAFTVPAGENIDLNGRDGDWAEVVYRERIGYVRYDVFYQSVEIPDTLVSGRSE